MIFDEMLEGFGDREIPEPFFVENMERSFLSPFTSLGILVSVVPFPPEIPIVLSSIFSVEVSLFPPVVSLESSVILSSTTRRLFVVTLLTTTIGFVSAAMTVPFKGTES